MHTDLRYLSSRIQAEAGVSARKKQLRESFPDVNLLRQYVADAEELHYGRAAIRLHMAQPPLSQGIMQLEEIVGVMLLERSKHSVRLTPAGAVFLDQARELIAQDERAVEAARLTAKGVIGKVAVGFVGSVSYELLPRILQEFRTRFPAIKVDLREQTSKEQVESLLAGKVDLGLLRLPVSNASELQLRVIHRERFVAVLPRGHKLASARTPCSKPGRCQAWSAWSLPASELFCCLPRFAASRTRG